MLPHKKTLFLSLPALLRLSSGSFAYQSERLFVGMCYLEKQLPQRLTGFEGLNNAVEELQSYCCRFQVKVEFVMTAEVMGPI